MNRGGSAADRLKLGDEVDRLTRAGSLKHAAARLSITVAAAEKARWLARVYAAPERHALGGAALAALSPSHLEAAFPAGTGRVALLRRAVQDCLPVREVRALASQPAAAAALEDGVTVLGAAADLASATASLARYTQWDDRRLGMLLVGPNGATVRTLALTGRALADRLGLTG